jgi:glycosyltransferase involved in cell wall biosynthesis
MPTTTASGKWKREGYSNQNVKNVDGANPPWLQSPGSIERADREVLWLKYLDANLKDVITFVVFTFNEEKRVERVIENVMKCGRVLIVDNESTDQTLAIARRHGCEILTNKNAGWVEDEVTAARVREHVQTPWIYWGFADEMVDRATVEVILRAISDDECDIINIARKNYYYGQFCRDVGVDRMNRIFRKGAIDFEGNKLHGFGRPVLGSRILKLPRTYFVHHFISNTSKSYLGVMDRYSDMESAERRPPPSILRLLSSTLKLIVLNLVVRRGYRARVPGLFLTCNFIYYRWLSAMKAYESEHKLDREDIERRNDNVRDSILASFE